MLGSTTRELSGVDTTSAVTRAPMAFARSMPCFIAALDSSDPSVGSRICWYMRLLPPPCWDGIAAGVIDMNQAPAGCAERSHLARQIAGVALGRGRIHRDVGIKGVE